MPRLRKLIPLLGALIAPATWASAPLLHLDAPREDYPAEALAQRLTGNVIVHLHISPDGGLRCTADSDDRLAVLKRPSCLLIAKRDVFAPSLDAHGRAIDTDVDLLVRWRDTPTDMQYGGAIAIAPEHWLTDKDVFNVTGNTGPWGRVQMTFTVTPMGRVANCKVVSGVLGDIDDAACPTFTKRAIFLPALGPDGIPMAVKGSPSQDWYPSPDRPN